MRLTQLYRQLNRINLAVLSVLIFSSVLILSTCRQKKDVQLDFPMREYFNGQVTMRVPRDWHSIDWPGKWIDYPYDSTSSLLWGLSNNCGMHMQLKYRNPSSIANASTREILNVIESSRSSAKILSVKIDSVRNSAEVDFIGWLDDSKKLYYFKHVLIIHDRKWVIIELYGPQNKYFIANINLISSSVKVR